MIKWILCKVLRHSDKDYAVGEKGKNCVIMPGCTLGHAENIILGDYVYIGEGTRIYAQGKVMVKSGSVLADTVDIRTGSLWVPRHRQRCAAEVIIS